MKKFMNENFLLKNEYAVKLYHNYAKDMPIFDYHCHVNVNEILEDKKYDNLTQVWLYADHYKWRAMRLFGIEEKYITGDASDYDKFLAYARTVSSAIGNPLYHWTHLELKKYFGIDEVLNEKTAPEIWEKTKNVLLNGLTTRKMIEISNVKALCSTDDPIDDLIYHKKLKNEANFSVKVLPTFRPDKAVEIDAEGFFEYIKKLGKSADIDILDIESLKNAFKLRLDYFQEAGCILSDHSISYAPYFEADIKDIDNIFQKAMNKESLSKKEADAYKTYIIKFLANEYFERNMAMQIHIGALRRVNQTMTSMVGADTGFDSIDDNNIALNLGKLLNSINYSGMPRTILYCLNPKDNYVLGTMIGNFAEGGIAGKLQFGSAWWFNDTRDGMELQMKTLANLGLISKFVGMLTDSRSFTSYTRFEYFRRILCNIIGTWIEDGEIDDDLDFMGAIIKDICFNNVKNYLSID